MHLCDSCNMKNCNDRTVRDLQNPACVISCSDYIGRPPTFLEIAEQCERVYGPYVPTNADRIRAMSDEELAGIVHAVYLSEDCPFSSADCENCLFRKICEGNYKTESEWLKQPAEDRQ